MKLFRHGTLRSPVGTYRFALMVMVPILIYAAPLLGGIVVGHVTDPYGGCTLHTTAVKRAHPL